jgi:cytoskeletal protein RodZ
VKQIGDWLKEARLERGLSLDQVQEITKIRSRYLEGMEAGDFSVLPGEAYTRAFIRTYAVGIGLDPRPLMSRYHDLYTRTVVDAEQAVPVHVPASASKRLVRNLFATLNGTMEWLGL